MYEWQAPKNSKPFFVILNLPAYRVLGRFQDLLLSSWTWFRISFGCRNKFGMTRELMSSWIYFRISLGSRNEFGMTLRSQNLSKTVSRQFGMTQAGSAWQCCIVLSSWIYFRIFFCHPELGSGSRYNFNRDAEPSSAWHFWDDNSVNYKPE